MFLTDEEARELLMKSKNSPMVKILAENEKIPITGILKYDVKLHRLVADIILEKWSLEDGDFKDGNISEILLKKICRVIRERIEDNIKKECNLEASLEWELDENLYTRVIK